MNEWLKIWKKKGFSNLKKKRFSLEDLIKIDGYDTPTSGDIHKIWNRRSDFIIKILEINEDDFILEIGSGAGAISYSLKKSLPSVKVIGIDYAISLLKISKKINKKIIHVNAEAKKIPFKKNIFNKIISHGVLCYFPSYDYTLESLKEMDRLITFDGRILLVDIPDVLKKQECEKVRMQNIGRKIYEKKYINCPHLYYDKNFFIHFAKDFGYRIIFFETPEEEYPMSLFRYHVILERKAMA